MHTLKPRLATPRGWLGGRIIRVVSVEFLIYPKCVKTHSALKLVPLNDEV